MCRDGFALLGEKVTVSIDRRDAPALTRTGTLLGTGQGGEYIIEDEWGRVWYGWPAERNGHATQER